MRFAGQGTMPLQSADKAFGLIALQRKYLTVEALVAAEKELEARRAKGVQETLGDYLVAQKLLEARRQKSIEKSRAAQGRHCHSCARVTYLLPGEVDSRKPCEHCGGRLRQRAPEHVKNAPASEPEPTPPSGRIAAVLGGADPRRDTERLRRLQDAALAPADAGVASPSRAAGTPSSTRVTATRSSARVAPAAPTSPGPPGTPLASAPATGTPSRRFDLAGLGPGGLVAPAPDVGPAPLPDPLAASGRSLPESFLDDLGEIAQFPFRGLGLVVITVPAILVALAVALGAGAHTVGLFFLLSLLVYQGRTIQQVVAGDRSPPPRPGCLETLQLAWQPLVAVAACFIPFILVYSFTLKQAIATVADDVQQIVSIGADAHLRSSRTTKSQGAYVGDVTLHELMGKEVRVGDRDGKWLVMGLVQRARDMTDEDRTRADAELQDLARLSEVAKDVDVAAVWIDPDDRIDERVRPARAGFLKLWRTRDTALPPPLEDVRPPIPTVWIVSPKGEIKKEFDAGASDEALFGSLLVLQAGRALGETIKLVPLPGHDAHGLGSGVTLVAGAFFLVGALYWPMALLMTLFGDPLRAFRYHEGIKAISTTFEDYVLLEGIAAGVAVVLFFGARAAAASQNEVAKAFATWWLLIAGALLLGGAIGRFYLHNVKHLAWVPKRPPKKPPEAAPLAPQPAGPAPPAA